ncbi:hypothetical protein [Frankia sp. AgB32]|uniref:hypothetical protein n=1 Tax=Frankia sp. AgB32 TaxID=631119 RepID=UPI00200D3627|nr:hypothetical protein [Frankia sp. AgB32]MCK9893039.1 hypothetical protein [Frankia sp. AgB32]
MAAPIQQRQIDITRVRSVLPANGDWCEIRNARIEIIEFDQGVLRQCLVADQLASIEYDGAAALNEFFIPIDQIIGWIARKTDPRAPASPDRGVPATAADG